ncbi:rRNA-processing protein cgr1 [Hypoxylon texense]
MVDFVKAVVQDRGSSDIGPEEHEILSSLRSLKFAEVCQKVYFPIEDYSEAEYIIANGVLSHLFSEHAVISGLADYREYFQLCRKNLHVAILRLPLLIPASPEVIAALTLAAYNSVENSNATAAWSFISAASDLCQRLGYHRFHPTRDVDPTVRTIQENLFWTVYRLDKGLSLRFGRSSNIHDAEITLPVDANELQSTKLARIMGKVYDRLYSPIGLCRSNDDRGHMAEELAGELRDLLNKTHIDITDAEGRLSDGESDPMRIVYLRCDLVCQSSLLTLILRAIPTVPGSANGVSDECVAVAREVMERHQQCIMEVRACKNDPSMVTKYINWALLHTPFVPFSILFTRAVQFLDLADLALLDRFTASLKPDAASPESITHPYRLYELLCQTARLYINSRTVSSLMNPVLTPYMTSFLDDSALLGMGLVTTEGEASELDGSQMYGLSDWYYGNQQIMSLIDNDVDF